MFKKEYKVVEKYSSGVKVKYYTKLTKKGFNELVREYEENKKIQEVERFGNKGLIAWVI